MTTAVEHEATPAPGDEHTHGAHTTHSDAFYVKIALVLAALTALEVSTYYVDFGSLFLPVLFALMVIKFFMVVWFFMHLRDDAKLFGRLFWAGLFLAIAVYVGALATFQFFLK
jgi:cytochrome c oxidase subunit 4